MGIALAYSRLTHETCAENDGGHDVTHLSIRREGFKQNTTDFA